MNAPLHSDGHLLASTLADPSKLTHAYKAWFHDWDYVIQEAQHEREEDITLLGRVYSRSERNSATIAAKAVLVACNRMHAAPGGPRALNAEAAAQNIIDGLALHADSRGNGSAKFNAGMAEVARVRFGRRRNIGRGM